MDLNRIGKTRLGFNYVEVTPGEILNWGGICICNSCGHQFLNENMFLVFVLGDTYCRKCFETWKIRAGRDLTEAEILEDQKFKMKFPKNGTSII